MTTAPLEQRDVWVVEREIKGIGYGPNARPNVHQYLVGDDWRSKKEWDRAKNGRKNKNITIEDEEILNNGHSKA